MTIRHSVIPAKVGIQMPDADPLRMPLRFWIPAFAGMTGEGVDV